MASADIVLRTPDLATEQASVSSLSQRAESLVVKDVVTHKAAQILLKECKRAEDVVLEKLGPIIKSAYVAHRALTGLRDDMLRPIEVARSALSVKCGQYEAAMQREAEMEQRRLELLARAAEEERRLSDALAAEAEGRPEEATAILDEEPIVPVIRVEPETAKVEGVATRTVWRAQITDFALFVKYVADHPEWLHLVTANTPQLNAVARMQRQSLRLPGVRAISETIKAIRG